MRWATGQAGGAALPDEVSVIVLENSDHLTTVIESGLAGQDTVIFVPDGPGDAAGPVVVPYEGSASEPGAEMSLSETFFLQMQDYATSEYMSVIGPTAIRIFGEEDFELYLSDADRAAAEGHFAEFLTHPTVRLADVPALGAAPEPAGRHPGPNAGSGPGAGLGSGAGSGSVAGLGSGAGSGSGADLGSDGPRLRLHAGPDGELSTSPTGLPLGKVGDDLTVLTAAWTRINAGSSHPCAVCLGAAVPEETRTAELAARPWLGRYLAALTGIRDLRLRGASDVRVSGFGGRLSTALESVAAPADLARPELPLLLWTDDAAYVHQQWPARTFEVERRAGELAETLLVCGSIEAAAEHDGQAGLDTVAAYFSKAGVRLT
ncbi:daptide biosynthesis RiPP recognition protein [Nonomuraea insulae]|uniref:Daptide biosynthesis RiPP recognition protein n=1 Tax=Nonomuraea insulae TaxID=1616787 RepID=A0ABW1CPZ1_9ACTN